MNIEHLERVKVFAENKYTRDAQKGKLLKD